MDNIVNDDLLLKIAMEELQTYTKQYSQEGLVFGNVYADKITAIYDLLVKIYGVPYLKEHGIEMVEE